MTRLYRSVRALRCVVGVGAAGLLGLSALVATSTAAQARDDGGHDIGEMRVPINGRLAAVRTTTVDPAAGPNFELPFPCGQTWTGTTRSSHSPSPYAVDFNAPNDLGKPVLAAARGVVTRVQRGTTGYGNYLIIDHGNGYTTLYAHLKQARAFVGEVVDQGTFIGLLGESGNVTGPHLHFEERLNGAYFPPYFHRTTYRFGTTTASTDCPDIPLAGDWNRDGRTDVGIFRQTATTGSFLTRVNGVDTATSYGRAASVPFVGDWDGDRVPQPGIRGLMSTTFQLRGATGGTSTASLGGAVTDVPLAGRWSISSTKTGLGTWRADIHRFLLRMPDLTTQTISFGVAGAQPVTGDWNGDGITDVGTFDPSTGMWSLRVPTTAGGFTTQSFKFGMPYCDIPVVGDWDGDGISDPGVWRLRQGRFLLAQRTTGSARLGNTAVVMGTKR